MSENFIIRQYCSFHNLKYKRLARHFLTSLLSDVIFMVVQGYCITSLISDRLNLQDINHEKDHPSYSGNGSPTTIKSVTIGNK